jgi:regulator of sigma E protease
LVNHLVVLLAQANSGGDFSAWLTFWYNVALVLLGLNVVILVHELGHFLVARYFNVQCEKFYIWFDIFGLRIFRFRRGETEYGLGILPLGGYVKMLGQEDNPARLREEIERARIRMPAGESSAQGQQGDASDIAVAAEAERVLFDPRSYLAQSVPRRMAIISAGVVMNLVFALVAAVLAYLLGVEQQACTVGVVIPGEAAWRAGIRPGDQIESIAGRPTTRFTDLQRAISVGNIDQGVPLTVRRFTVDGQELLISLTVHPDRIRAAPTIGVTNGFSHRLHPEMAAWPDSPAARATPALEPGDEIIAVEGRPVSHYGQIHALLARWPDRPLKLRVRRAADLKTGNSASPQELEVSVPPRQVPHLGFVLRMGPVVAVQDGSPAHQAGISPGDFLTAIDGKPVGDPLRLPEEVRRLADQKSTVKVTVRRSTTNELFTVDMPLRLPEWFDIPLTPTSPTTIPVWGLAYRVIPEVMEVLRDGPAASSPLRPGIRIVEVRFRVPESPASARSPGGVRAAPLTLRFDGPDADWSLAHFTLLGAPVGTEVELVLADGGTCVLRPVVAENWYHPDRGLLFASDSFMLKAANPWQALVFGSEETWSALTLIVRTLQKLGTGQVSPRGLAGPVGIAQIAYHYASEGLATFLIFLCLLSANLAVLNFIPIPVLDGGHMLFLIYEGIRGKPPSESVVAILTFAGLIFLLGLMIWVTGMDVMRIFGG